MKTKIKGKMKNKKKQNYIAKRELLCMVMIVLSLFVKGQTTLWNETFESTNSLTLVQGSQSNYWLRGTSTSYAGSNSMYITNDGSANVYLIGTASVSHAYKDLTFPAGATNITLTFYWKGYGESGYDFLKTYLVPVSTTLVAGTELSTGQIGTSTGYNLSSTFAQATISLGAVAGTTQRLVFSWRNDASLGTQPPAVIDNIVVTYTTCVPIITLPWTEKFDGTTIPSLPSCWYKENGDWITTNNSNSTYDADARSGTQFLSESWSASNEYIWTPGFNLTAGNSYDFSFWWAGDTYPGWTGDVFYNTSQISTSATQMGASFVADATTTTKTYAQIIRTFTPTVSGTYYFAIRVNCPTSTPWYLSFDDFRLEATNLTVPASGNNSYIVCDQHIYDYGGPTGDYSVSTDGYTVLYPSTAGNVIQISGTSAGESCCDYIEIYNGIGTGGILLGKYFMGTSIPTITSGDVMGALTIRFYSDVSSVGAGFNIAISCVAPCVTPGNPTNLISSVTGNSIATVSWSAGVPAGSAIVSYYVTVYNAIDNSVAIATTNITGTSANLTGLHCGTSYYFTVYASSTCGSLISGTIISGNFTTTAPAAAALPFTEGFNSPPACWTQQCLTGTADLLISASTSSPTTTPNEGSNYLYWNSFSISSGNETRFYSPAISTLGTNNLEVRFFWMNENSTSYNSGNYLLEGVQVQYSLDKVNWIDAGSFVPRYDATLVSGVAQWKIKEIFLPASASNQSAIYIGLKFYSAYGNNCSLDNLWVGKKYTDPLPISLLSFTGQCENGKITLDWVTATETNNAFFTLEKSSDGIHWDFLAKVDGAENSNQQKYYTITTESNDNYYRLTQTDFDGKFEIFPPIVVNCDNLSSIKIYPNPVTDVLFVESSEMIVYQLFTSEGQLLMSGTESTLDMSKFVSGIYILKIKTMTGIPVVKKIIKK